jgi:hypothetical protein
MFQCFKVLSSGDNVFQKHQKTPSKILLKGFKTTQHWFLVVHTNTIIMAHTLTPADLLTSVLC